MTGTYDPEEWSLCNPNQVLDSLLAILDATIENVGFTAQEKTRSSLEAELEDALHQAIPDARFLAIDIRQWVTYITEESSPLPKR